jgi:hypothetical protein
VLDEEAPNLVEFNVCLFGGHVGRASHPPVCTRETGRQVCPAPCSVLPVRSSWAREYLTVSGLEQTDERAMRSKDYRVKPTPDNQIGTVRSGRNGNEVARPKFGGSGPERRGVPHRRCPTFPEDHAGLEIGVEYDGRPQAIGVGHGCEGSAGTKSSAARVGPELVRQRPISTDLDHRHLP